MLEELYFPKQTTPNYTPHTALFKFLFSSLTELAGLQYSFFFEILVFLAGWLYTTWSSRKQLQSQSKCLLYTSLPVYHLFAFLGLTGLTRDRPLAAW